MVVVYYGDGGVGGGVWRWFIMVMVLSEVRPKVVYFGDGGVWLQRTGEVVVVARMRCCMVVVCDG
ncbi:hypothetical protein HanIR_Chr17g0889021 [Helianthus annuus]|nr:hypothetical protein HanIR_Chr17g0889021 [Helianthus annuus]